MGNSEEADVLRLTTKTTLLLQTVPTTVFKSYATVTECIFATLAAKGQTLHSRVHLLLLSMTLDTFFAERENHCVQVLRYSDGTHVRTIGGKGSGKEQINDPSCIAIDRCGCIAVADTQNNRVLVFK